MIHRRSCAVMLAAAQIVAGLGLAFTGTAVAQTYPSKPVRVLVGYAAGGAIDNTTRIISPQWEKQLGQPILIENRPGASGALAGHATVRAAPDGYQLIMASGTGFHELFLKDNPIDASKDLSAVGMSTFTPNYVLVRSNLPISTPQEYIAYAKANRGKINSGSAASNMMLLMKLFESKVGIDSVNVPYNGSGPVATAMLGNQVDVSASVLSAFLPAVQSGKVKPLFSTQRSATYPNLPTAADLGLADFDIGSTLGLWAPRNTPAAVIRTLTTANAAAVKSPDVVAALAKQDTVPVGSTPEEAMRSFEREVQFWRAAIRIAGFKPE